MNYNWKKNTGIFLSSQAVSILGSSLVQFAITSYITVETKSGIYATIGILCSILPMFLLSPFAGVWADKYSRKNLIMIADGGISICTLVVATLFMMGFGSIWLLFVGLVIRALGSAVQNPSVSALLPDIVPEKHLTRVNGINGTLQALFALVSPMLGALLLTIAPLWVIFLIDIITAVIAIVIMLTAFRLPPKTEEAEEKTTNNYFLDMKEGFKYIFRTRYLMEFFGYCIMYFIMMAPAAFLTQVQVVRNYGDNYWYLSSIQIAYAVGMLLGGVLITVWGGFKNKTYTIMTAGVMLGTCTLALGLSMPFISYIIVMGALGVALTLLSTPAMTMLQERVDSNYRGRVLAVMNMINTSMMPLGMIIFGPIADVVSVEILFIIAGIITVITALSMIRAKELCRAGGIA